MIVLGLTGSIGMGKSTVAAMLTELGVPVHDSDKAAHAAMQQGSSGYDAIVAAFPQFAGREIDRLALGAVVFAHDEKRKTLEDILHPLVRAAQQDFLRAQAQAGRDMAALDIPLLFETGGEARVDYTIVASAPAPVQRARVLARPGMTAEKFEAILARQMPDAEKRRRADFVIDTGRDPAQSMAELRQVLEEIRARGKEKA